MLMTLIRTLGRAAAVLILATSPVPAQDDGNLFECDIDPGAERARETVDNPLDRLLQDLFEDVGASEDAPKTLDGLLGRLIEGSKTGRRFGESASNGAYEQTQEDVVLIVNFLHRLTSARFCDDFETVAQLEAAMAVVAAMAGPPELQFLPPVAADIDDDDGNDGEFGDGDIVLGPEGSDDRDGSQPPAGLVDGDPQDPARGDTDTDDRARDVEDPEAEDGTTKPVDFEMPAPPKTEELELAEVDPIVPEIATPEELATLFPPDTGTFDIITGAGANPDLTACRAASPALFCQNFDGALKSECAMTIQREQASCAASVNAAPDQCVASCQRRAYELRVSETLIRLANKSVTDNYTAVERILSEFPEFIHVRPTLDAWREQSLKWWTWGTSPMLPVDLRCEGDAIPTFLDQCMALCADSSALYAQSCRPMGQFAVGLPTAKVHLDPPGWMLGIGQ